MGKKILSFILASFLLTCFCFAESLWNKKNSKSLYTDSKASVIGDILTIIIVETAVADQCASTALEKSTQIEGSDFTGIVEKFFNPFSVEAGDDFQTQGTTKQSQNLRAKITAQIVEVLPNGNFVIEGKRSVVVNKDKQVIVLSGIIRPEDITKDNTILSSLISDAQIRYEGEGIIAKRQKPGILTKIFNMIF